MLFDRRGVSRLYRFVGDIAFLDVLTVDGLDLVLRRNSVKRGYKMMLRPDFSVVAVVVPDSTPLQWPMPRLVGLVVDIVVWPLLSLSMAGTKGLLSPATNPKSHGISVPRVNEG